MSALSQAASGAEKRTNARYWIVVMLFIVTSFNYGDRAALLQSLIFAKNQTLRPQPVVVSESDLTKCAR